MRTVAGQTRTEALLCKVIYIADNRLIQVNVIGGGVTTLTYNGTTGFLDSIAEPGERALSLTHDTYGNLTQITNVDGTTRTLGYSYSDPGNHLIVEDQWSPLDATFTYDTTTNLLTQVNLGLGSVYTIASAAAAQPTQQEMMGASVAAAWASITDGDGHKTQYLLDLQGRLLEQIQPDGTSTSYYVLNAAGLPTLSVDPMGRPTFDTYDNFGDVLKQTNADGSWTQYTYDPTFHQVTSTLNSMGETTSNTYDPVTGDLLTSTDALGAVTTYTYYQTNGKSNGLVYSVTTPTETGTATSYNYYDAARRLIVSFDNLGVPTYYSYDVNGNPYTTTDVYGRTTTTLYNARDWLMATIDPMGAVTSQTYNPYGLQTSSTDAMGYKSTTTYDQRGWVVAQTDNMGVTTATDSYDAAGNLIQQNDANGNPTYYAYNADSEQIQTTYANGTTSSASYNPDGQVVSSTDQLNRTTTDSYNLVGEEIATTDPMGYTNTTLYNSVGDVIRTTDAMGLSTLDFYNADNEEIASSQQVSSGVWATTKSVYDLAGQVVASVDAMGHVTADNYNADGEQTGTTDANGKTSTDVYDLSGNLIQSTDARGKTTYYFYNADNQQIATLDSDGNWTRTVYNADGNVIMTMDPKGTTYTYYDGDGRVTATVNADGGVSQTFYDKNGNVVESIDPNGKISLTWYNNLNEAVLSQGPNGHFTATAYNAVGDVVTSSDGAGDVTWNNYNSDNEIISTVDGNGSVTQFGYNADGQQISETDALGNTTYYVLNGLGETVATVDPLGDVTRDVYNLNGQVVSQTDSLGRTITYAYDNNGNLLTETDYNANGTVQDVKSYTYDANGNMLTATNGYGTYTMTYDNNGNLLTRTDPFGLTLTYGYDGNGNVTSIKDSLGGTTTKVYDANNQLTSIQFTNGTSQARLDLTYTKDGQLATQTRYADVAGTQLVGTTTYTYDAAGNTTEIKHTNATGGVIGDYVYKYDTANRLISETDTQNGGAPVTTTYGYDKASQLTSVNGSGYTYDSNGNRTTIGYLTGPGNRLLSDGTWNYAYDAAGNTILKTKIATGEYWTFAWNNANQLTLASDFDVHGNLIQSVAFQYDVFGNMVQQDTYTASNGQTATTKYAYNANGNIWADLNASNQLVTRRLFVSINGQTQPFARIDAAGNTAWYLTDHLGSVRLLTDNSGAVIDQIDYDAYGNITNETNPSNGDRYKYASGQYSTILGMTFYGENGKGRWYNPATGSWSNVDPSGLSAGPNPYDYVANNPTNAIDPTGLREADDRLTSKTKNLVDVSNHLENYVNRIIKEVWSASKKEGKGSAAFVASVFEALGADAPGTGLETPIGTIAQIAKIGVYLDRNLCEGNMSVSLAFKDSRYRDNPVGDFSNFKGMTDLITDSGSRTALANSTCGRPWLTTRETADHGIAPTIRIKDTLMGTDKWEQFFWSRVLVFLWRAKPKDWHEYKFDSNCVWEIS